MHIGPRDDAFYQALTPVFRSSKTLGFWPRCNRSTTPFQLLRTCPEAGGRRIFSHMTIRLRNMTRERGSILATNRGLRRMRYEIIALTILAVSGGDSPTRVPGSRPASSARSGGSHAGPHAGPPRRRRRRRHAHVPASSSGRRASPRAKPPRTPHSRRYTEGSDNVTATSSWNPQSNPPWSPIYFTAPGVALGTRPGEGIVGRTWAAERPPWVFVLEAGTFKLTGVLSETHGQTLPGVSIDVIGGTGRGLHTTTDMNGRYTLYGVAGRVQLRASADGLAAVTREVEVLSDSESDAFVRISILAPGDISGPWTMTLSPAVNCPAGFPEIATGRTYEVRFSQTGTHLKVATSSPTLEVRNPDENYGTIFGSSLRFSFIGDTEYGGWSSADPIDHLSATERLEFDGTVVGTVTGSEIRARMDGDLVFWDEHSRGWSPSWYCRNANHLVTLRRQP